MTSERRALAYAIATLAIGFSSPALAQSADENAIRKVIRTETEAYYGRSADAWQATWVQDSTAMRTFVQSGSFEVDAGWEKFGPGTTKYLKDAGKPVPIQLQTSNYRMRVGGGLAWVEYDQRITTAGDTTNPYVSREQRALVRKDGRWKIMSALTEDVGGFGSSPRAIESQLNGTGYALLSAKRANDAIEVLKLNVGLFPNSFNTYDSLGEAYLAAGETQLAIQNYEKSVALNPNNENGKQVLAKLRSVKTP
ncbi:MAG: nuclear transport factor 2 family protein [Gemmatimonadaceae bacterium]